MTVAENIKTIRKQKGLTQKQLAEMLGISTSAVQQFEYGKIVPKMDTVLLMSTKLNVSPKAINPEISWDDYIDRDGLIMKDISNFTDEELITELARRLKKKKKKKKRC